MQSDFDEQADLFLAVFWNENGNVALCRVVFASREQALDWAENELRQHTRVPSELVRTNDGVTFSPKRGSELGWRVISAVGAEADREVGSISTHHVESIR